MIVVSDTSPISNLLQIGRIELLLDLFGRVIIPPPVAHELQVEHGSLPTFLQVIRPTNAREVRRLTGLLDSGEAEAIVVAGELHADRLLIDEKAGRRVAQESGLRIIGLAGILLLAKQRGLIAQVREPLRQLVVSGFYLDEEIQHQVLQAAGEE
jgi:predicted nucleic acid-binding protein